MFRALADVFADHANGQPMVIKNVEGASGVTGSTEFMDAEADGYKVMHVNTAHVSKIHMSEVPYDITSFEPVIQIVESYNYLLVNADAKWNTLDEFIADAKAAPGTISIGNAGVAAETIWLPCSSSRRLTRNSRTSPTAAAARPSPACSAERLTRPCATPRRA